jgi:hypothetical protein
MTIRIDSYLADGVVTGEVIGAGRLRELLEALDSVIIHGATVAPLEGSQPAPSGPQEIAVDDLLVVVSDDLAPPVHAVWHAVRLDVGPYRIEGELPTLPGFDPSRALMRPTGVFVQLDHARVHIRELPDAGVGEHEHVLVNRYAVEAVEADLMLGFYFPGARLQVTGEAASPAPVG